MRLVFFDMEIKCLDFVCNMIQILLSSSGPRHSKGMTTVGLCPSRQELITRAMPIREGFAYYS
jgi:hypothetical protein